MKNKVFFIQGGLGNQVCILAKAFEENKDNSKIILNLSSYFLLPHRSFNVDKYFDISPFEIQKGNILSFLLFRFFNKVMEKLNKNQICVFNYIFYFGYFQKDIDNRIFKIKKFFKFNNLPSHPSLCVHIRRGDYTKNKYKNFHGLVSVEDVILLINQNIQFIKKNFTNISLISEDQNLDFPNQIGGLAVNKFVGNDHESFLQMVTAKGLIASNSTYSLIAGLINTKILFLIPSQWFRNQSSKFLGKSLITYKCTLL